MTPLTDGTVTIAVLGPGSWGTALAILLARNGYDVRLWGLESDIGALAHDRENRRYLPGIPLPENLRPETDMAAATAAADEILVVVPSHAFAAVLDEVRRQKPGPVSLSWATKGFDPDSGRLLSEVAAQQIPDCSPAVISGPTFAAEVAGGLPTAITAASPDPDHAERLADLLHSPTFRAYTSTDLIGVQVGGATKNIMAIAAGISDGLGFGANARAALITRGLAEIGRLGLALGGRAETFMGLAGLGDLALTCTDDQSRNRRMGLALARGLAIDEAKAEIRQEVEGIDTARVVWRKALELDVEMPITDAVYQVLFEGRDPRQAVRGLLDRQQKAETG